MRQGINLKKEFSAGKSMSSKLMKALMKLKTIDYLNSYHLNLNISRIPYAIIKIRTFRKELMFLSVYCKCFIRKLILAPEFSGFLKFDFSLLLCLQLLISS